MLGLALVAVAAGGCMRGCTSSSPPIHLNPNMDHQPKYKAQAESAFFYDGATMRPPVEGTVARDEVIDDPGFVTGLDAAGNVLATNPLAIDDAVLARGKERFEIYCLPCHGATGNGRGMLFERAGVQAGDLHQERIVAMPDGEMFGVVTNGLGLMSGYRYPIPPRDRWAIIAYVRQLQNGS